MKCIAALALMITVLTPSVLMAQQGDGTRTSTTANVFKPAKISATPERMAQVTAPNGFKVAPFATGLKNNAYLRSLRTGRYMPPAARRAT